MFNLTRTIIVLLAIGIGCATAYAEEPSIPADDFHLSTDLRSLLRGEMRELAEASQALVMCLVSGDWEAVERISEKIGASYVMQKKLSDSQKQELKDKLPDRFKWLDSDFHARAEKLGQAASAKDPETAVFQYSRLLESCAECHAAYAQMRFPGFSKKTPEVHHH